MDNREPSEAARNKTLAFTTFPMYEEYLHQSLTLAPRLYQRAREIRLSTDDQSYFCTYPDFLHFVALISEETPDSWIVPPIWAQIVRTCPRFSLRLLTETGDLSSLAYLLDESDMAEFLEEQDLPTLFIFDEEWNLQAQWGPHPQSFDGFLDAWLTDHPDYERLTQSDDPADIAEYAIQAQQLAGEMRVWYNDSLNHECVAEIRSLLAALNEDSSDPDESEGDDLDSDELNGDEAEENE